MPDHRAFATTLFHPESEAIVIQIVSAASLSPDVAAMFALQQPATKIARLGSATNVARLGLVTNIARLGLATTISHLGTATNVGPLGSATNVVHLMSATNFGHPGSATDFPLLGWLAGEVSANTRCQANHSCIHVRIQAKDRHTQIRQSQDKDDRHV